MKILCVADEGIKVAALQRACEIFPKAEIVIEAAPENVRKNLRIMEKDGPDAVPIPAVMRAHTDADIIIGGILCPFSRRIIEMFPNLKVIGLCRAGVENIDMAAAAEKDILVVNGLGRNAHAVSDFTVALMLSEVRNVARSHALLTTEEGSWAKDFVSASYVPHITECKIGVLGFGMIGRLVCQKLTGFGCEIMVQDPFVPAEDIRSLGYTPVDLQTMFQEADIITLHARYSEATDKMVSKALLDSMKPTAYLINTARSGLVDMDALYQALTQHRIGGAGLDVFPDEPLPADSPWRKLDNCTITGHLAGSVMASRDYAAKLVAESIKKALGGESVPQVVTKNLLTDAGFRQWAAQALSKLS